MKHFWALPALLRPALVLASHHAFSVNEDLMAFPQYEIQFSEDYVSDVLAESRIRNNQRKTSQARANDDTSSDAQSHVDRYQPPPAYEQRQDGKTEGREGELEYEMMVLDTQKYLCAVPQVFMLSDLPTGNETASKREHEKELSRANDRGWELLSGMQGNCVYFISGWWSYSFCYNQGVKQFHPLPPTRGMPIHPPMEDPGVEGFVLGTYKQNQPKAVRTQHVEEVRDAASEVGQHSKSSSTANGELIAKGDTRYLVQKLEGGTVCDLTGKDRRIEVQFHCNPTTGSDRISLIKELSICTYLMVIQTPRLCNDVAFMPPQKEQANRIQCQPIVKPEDVEQYGKELDAAKATLQETEQWEQEVKAAMESSPDGDNAPLQIVGDIIVGGHSIVPEGVKLERSAIVGGGKETYVDTLANSQGRVLNRAEMEKLGLSDAKAFEKLKKDIETMAAGAQWKLDVIDTPRGREYRAIIGDEETVAESEGDQGQEDEKEAEQEGSQEEYYQEEL